MIDHSHAGRPVDPSGTPPSSHGGQKLHSVGIVGSPSLMYCRYVSHPETRSAFKHTSPS